MEYLMSDSYKYKTLADIPIFSFNLQTTAGMIHIKFSKDVDDGDFLFLFCLHSFTVRYNRVRMFAVIY